MDTQRQFQKGNTMCALEGTHQKDKKWKDIPGGGETRSRGGSWRKVCQISFRWMNRGKKNLVSELQETPTSKTWTVEKELWQMVAPNFPPLLAIRLALVTRYWNMGGSAMCQSRPDAWNHFASPYFLISQLDTKAQGYMSHTEDGRTSSCLSPQTALSNRGPHLPLPSLLPLPPLDMIKK